MSDDVIQVEGLHVRFPVGRASAFGQRPQLHAVDGVSLQVRRGTTFGIVGQSGSGKSTLALALMRLTPIFAGRVTVAGLPVSKLGGRALRQARRHFQMVFQDPFASLDPRRRAGELIREPLDRMRLGNRAGRERRVLELLDLVGLPREAARLFPNQFSGGQRQRLCIARALAPEPDVIVCDEPVSALDVAIQAQILNLLGRLKRERQLTLLFISHDLAVVQHLCDEIAVMYLGQVMEQAEARTLFSQPRHPYTWSLIAAAVGGEHGAALRACFSAQGEPPSLVSPAPGCRFSSQCAYADARCRSETPALEEVAPGHLVACFRQASLPQPDFAIDAAPQTSAERALVPPVGR